MSAPSTTHPVGEPPPWGGGCPWGVTTPQGSDTGVPAAGRRLSWKWLSLQHPRRPEAGSCGYLRVSLAVLRAGETAAVSTPPSTLRPPWGAPVIFFFKLLFLILGYFGLFYSTPGARGTSGERGGGGQPPAAFAAHPVRGHAPAPRLPRRGPAPGCATGTGDAGVTGCPRTHLSSLPGAEEQTRSHLPSVLPAGGKRGFVAAAVRASFAGRTVGGGEHPWVLAVGGG